MYHPHLLLLFRAVINRYGFNSLGADAVDENISAYKKWARENKTRGKGKWWRVL
jgi:dihydroorotate dehydrogenase